MDVTSVNGLPGEDEPAFAPNIPARPALPEITVAEAALRLSAERRARGQWLNSALFQDPAWEILLELYCAQAKWGGCSLSRLLVGSFLQPETAERWIRLLEAEGLVEKYEGSSSEGLRLTVQGYGSMSCYLSQVAASWGHRIAD